MALLAAPQARPAISMAAASAAAPLPPPAPLAATAPHQARRCRRRCGPAAAAAAAPALLVAARTARTRTAASSSSTTTSTSSTSTTSTTSTSGEDGGKAQPDWTGDKLLSRAVNWMIDTKPIFNVMKLGAKQAMKSTTRRAGIDWDGHVRRMAATPELQQLCREFEAQGLGAPGGASNDDAPSSSSDAPPNPDNPAAAAASLYPDYYTVPFHAYDRGNLCWEAAYEVEPASYAIALRTFKTEPHLTGEEAMARLRGGINRELCGYLAARGVPAPREVLDVGCSTGISSRWYQRAWPTADVTGLDLSPYFLAVAELEERRRVAAGETQRRVKLVRGLAEAAPFPDAAFDLVVFSFVVHECPQAAIDAFIREARRLVRPGGVLAFVDNNPRSKTIQNLPPVLFALMKSTEPWSDEYYSYDLEEGMRRVGGFTDVVTSEADHRHRVVCGTAPPR